MTRHNDPMLSPGLVAVSGEVAALLGAEGVAAAMTRIQPTADCYLCDEPVAVGAEAALRVTHAEPVAWVHLTHRSCGNSVVVAGDSDAIPRTQYKIVASLWGGMPALLVNPEVNAISLMRDAEGRWGDMAADGSNGWLAVRSPDKVPTPRLGAYRITSSGMVTAQSTGTAWTVRTAGPVAEGFAAASSALVLVITDTPLSRISTEGEDALMEAISAGHVYSGTLMHVQ